MRGVPPKALFLALVWFFSIIGPVKIFATSAFFVLFCADVCLGYSKLQDWKMQDKYLAFWIQDIFPPTFFTSCNFLLMFLFSQAKIHSSRFEILQRFCLWVWVYCKMNHLIYALMQISSPGYYLTWIFPSGKNCHAVEFPGFKCESPWWHHFWATPYCLVNT